MKPGAASSARGCKPRLWVAAVVLLTVAAYGPVYRAGFVWDDDGHVTRPELQSLHGLRRIWFEIGATQQFYPVLHSAFWLEHRLWGDAPLGYHLLNVLLHATAACLLVLVLKRLRVPGAVLAGLAFAVHPVEVESVAWISEQKNTLSAVFYLCAGLMFLAWGEAGERGRRGRAAWYGGATVFFILALLSKSVTATLPAALLVALWWRHGRLSWREHVRPLVPWFGLALLAGVVTEWVERRYVGADGTQFALGAAQRILIAGRAAWFYAGKLAWPAPLVFVYPRWTVDPSVAWQWLYPAAALAAVALLWARQAWGALAAVLFFLGTLVPALGFFNVYPFVFSFVADHFQYLASAGLLVLAAAGWDRLFRHWGKTVRLWMGLAAGGVLALWTGLTWRQCRVYRNMESLYRSTLEGNPDSWLAHDNLGVVLASSGRREEAIAHYRSALRLKPDYPEAYNNLGNALAREGKWAEAALEYAAALRVRPGFAAAEYDWGNALSDQERYPEAVLHYERALRLRPGYPDAEYRLGNALANAGQPGRAIAHYERALRLRPGFAEAEANWGLALVTVGKAGEGIGHLQAAISLSPADAEAHAYLGFALGRSGHLDAAVAQFRESLRLHPDNPAAHYQLGLVLRALGRPAEAASEFRAAEGAHGR